MSLIMKVCVNANHTDIKKIKKALVVDSVCSFSNLDSEVFYNSYVDWVLIFLFFFFRKIS